ncbi:hypothetical protein ACS0TY_021289 [Phlomoides rotata]
MDSSKLAALLLISILSLSSATPLLQPECGYCSHPHPKPPVVKPPTVKPPITIPPVVNPKAPCPPPPATATCPIDTLKLGACVDLLGGLIHIGLGDPAANECCPLISGLVELEAAVCLCTTLKIKALNLNIYVPLALQLLITCGKAPPPGYTCSL